MHALLMLAALTLPGHFPAGAHAVSPAASPLAAEITIARVSADRWQVDYRFDEAVTALELGRPVAGYRAEAWTVTTPGVRLVLENGVETLVAADSARTHLRLLVDRHVPFSHDDYVPMVPFSDGGVALYIGYFAGVARAGGESRELAPRFRFVPLPSERVDAPERDGVDAFAYFGAARPVETEHARLILDPAVPDWLREELQRTIAATTGVLSEAVLPLPAKPLMLIGAHDFAGFDGGSLKGGVIGGRLVILLRGRAFVEPSPAKRSIVQRLVAHEVAHLFQLATIPTGAYNFEEPWLHEGAAEAMAILALGESGLWRPAQVDRYAAAAGTTCRDALAGRALADAVRAGRGDAVYPCGLDLFWSIGDGAIGAWLRLAESARQGGPFSTATLEATPRRD